MPVRHSTPPRTLPPLWVPPPSGSTFLRGALPSAPHKLMAAQPFLMTSAPAQFAVVPSRLSMWGNNQYGDCHDADTEVLTDRGWVKWPEYDGSALLGTMNTATEALEFQAPTRVVRRPHDGPMAYSSHRRLDFAVTPNHRMYHRPYSRVQSRYEPYRFVTADALPCQFSVPLATSGFVGTTLVRLGVGGRDWPGDDFLALVAVIVSDGWVSQENAIEFCCHREDRYAKVAALASRLGIKESDSQKGRWRFSDGALAEWLRANSFTEDGFGATNKRVPDLVKVADQSQIGLFLDFFGDQTTLRDGNRNFSSTSKRMVDDIQELLLRVGVAGTVYHGYSHKGCLIKGRWVECNNPCYTLHEAKSREVCLHQVKSGKGPSNIGWDNYKGEVFCATVPNGTLVTRRNGRVLISSNCVSAEEAFAKACHTPEIFIEDSVVIEWARQGGFLNGAMLDEVLDAMARHGFQVGSQLYNDGPKMTVDFGNQDVLRAAIAQGNVKIAMDANALPSGAGNQQGWYAFGGGRYPNTDHCFAGDTKVPLLDGRELSFAELANGAAGESFGVYSCDAEGNVVAGRAHSVRKTREDADLVRVTLDNGESVRCTMDHRFLMRDGAYREAKDLRAGDSLMPLYRRASKGGYELCYNPKIKGRPGWRATHRIVAFGPGGRSGGMAAHHVNFNKRNNDPSNLRVMTPAAHAALHERFGLKNKTPEHRDMARGLMASLWADPEWAARQRTRLSASASARGRRTAGLGHNFLQTVSEEARGEMAKRAGQKLRGRKRSQESIQLGRETKKKRFAEDPEYREALRRAALGASLEAAKRPITERQREARRENARRLNALKKKGLQASCPNNHKVVSVELCGSEDVYDLTVDTYHNFALAAGVFVHNCTGLSGYGTAGYCFRQLGVPVPSGVDPAKPDCYLHFTWSTIGVVDHAWLMGTCTEAWVRNPTTVGVPPLPAPPLDPDSWL